MRTNKTVKPSDKKPEIQRKETRRERRAIKRKMDNYFKLKCFQVEVEVCDVDETFWIIAIHEAHVDELLLASEENIQHPDIWSYNVLNPEQMKQVIIKSDDENKDPETTLWEVFQSYEGAGEIICSTMWID